MTGYLAHFPGKGNQLICESRKYLPPLRIIIHNKFDEHTILEKVERTDNVDCVFDRIEVLLPDKRHGF